MSYRHVTLKQYRKAMWKRRRRREQYRKIEQLKFAMWNRWDNFVCRLDRADDESMIAGILSAIFVAGIVMVIVFDYIGY